MTRDTMILIADGSRARLLSQDQAGKLTELDSWDAKHPNRAAQESDDGDSGQGNAKGFEQASPERHDKVVFAHRLASDLKARVQEFDKMILVASPKTLGDLRAELDDQILAKIEVQIDRDFTHFSLHDLPEHLEKAIAAKS